MDDKIKEVMGLVSQAMDRAMRAGELVLDESGKFDIAFKEGQLKRAAIESKLLELVPVWLPIESAEKPAIGANGFGERVLLRVDCGDGTLKSTKIGWWCDKWMMDTGGSVKENGYRAIGWMPLP